MSKHKLDRKAGATTLAKSSAGAQIGAYWGSKSRPKPREIVIKHAPRKAGP